MPPAPGPGRPLLVIFHDRHQSAADRQAGAVQGMHQLRLAGGGIAPARLHAPRLEILEVAAGGDLAILLLARQPHFQVVGLGGGKSDVAAAQATTR